MNSRGYTVTSIAIAFMAVTLLSVPGFGGNAYASHVDLMGISSTSGGVGMSLSVDADAGSNSIMVSGSTDRSDDVMIIVIAPNGNVVAIDQVTPSHNSYSATIGVGGSQYNQNGMYTIIATQAYGSLADVSLSNANPGIYQSITASTEVEIVDGHVVPEFGTIAAMILVVAIVAIIAVSAKTKLSLVPRY